MLRFEYFLARELKMTHGELRERITGKEFVHWVALFNIERREQERAQRRAQNRSRALRMSHAANAGGGLGS
jgi:hypothetical protein